MHKMMCRKVARDALLVALAPLWAGFLTSQVYRYGSEPVVDFENRNDAGFIAGFVGNRHDRSNGSRWTSRDSYLLFENLPLASPSYVEVRLRAPRPAGVMPPDIWFTSNGETVYRTSGRDEMATYGFVIPERGSSLRLGIHSETFAYPGLGPLGVELHSLSLHSAEGARPARKPIAWMMLGSVLLLTAGRVAGLGLTLASSFSILFSSGFAYLLFQDSVRFQAYPQQVAALSGLGILANRFRRSSSVASPGSLSRRSRG